ncbi:Hypothetical predicted protein [Octopus vulgaris]|uniref:Uncharacterized protein n=1 Tax=Octopus vulgaris TaxID=6645 RepID=A0AA36AIP8_OCTVU|nr:Hypothetical predicted protein [Octopus vulgaris]
MAIVDGVVGNVIGATVVSDAIAAVIALIDSSKEKLKLQEPQQVILLWKNALFKIFMGLQSRGKIAISIRVGCGGDGGGGSSGGDSGYSSRSIHAF